MRSVGFSLAVVALFEVFGGGFSQLWCGDKRTDYLDLRRQIGREEFNGAVLRCKQLLEAYPDYVYLYETMPEVSQYAGDLPGAVRYFESRIENGREIGLAYFGLGTTYYYLKDYKSAVLCLNKAVELGVNAPECYRTFEYAYEKLEGIDAAVRFFTWLSDRYPENANHRYAVALALWSKHDYQGVLSNIIQAISINPGEQKYLEAKVAMLLLIAPNKVDVAYIARRVQYANLRGDLDDSQFLQSYLAIVYLHKNNWDSLIAVASNIFDQAKRFGFYRWLGWASIRLSLGWYYIGEFQTSLQFSDRAAGAGERAGDEQLILAAFAWRFRACMQLGDFEQALATAFERIWKSLAQGNEREYISGLSDLSSAFLEVGEDSLALECAVEASSRAEAIRADWDLLHQTRNGLGLLYEAQGHARPALRYFKQAQEIVLNTNFPLGNSVASDGLLGNAYLNAGDFKLARRYLVKRLLCLQRIQLHCEEPSALSDLGRYYFLEKRYKQSRSFYQRAIALARKAGQMPVVQSCERGLAQIAEKLGQTNEALYWHAQLTVQSRPALLGGIALCSGGSLRFKSAEEFRDFARLLVGLNRFEDALVEVEKAKIQTELSPISMPCKVIIESLSDSSRTRFVRIRRDILRKCSALSKESSQKLPRTSLPHYLSLKSDLIGLEIEYWSIVNRARMQSKVSLLREESLVIDLKRFQQEFLEDDQALLEYSVDDGRTDGFLVKQDTVLHFVVDRTRKELSDLLAKTSLALSSSTGQNLVSSATLANFDPKTSMALYSLLISPIERQLKRISRLIIVPDDLLRRLPFETLLTPSSICSSSYTSQTHFLLERYELSYAPSLFMINHSNKKYRSAKKLILALGDPNGRAQQELASRVMEKFFSSRESVLENQGLPGAQQEVKRIREIFGDEVDALVGEEATKSKFRQIASDYRIIHLASHSNISDQDDLFSSIQLAADSQQEDNGLLYAFEFLDLSLNADLVVLSGCNSGVNRNPRGSNGLVAALFGAGATSVLSALWNVDDESTAELMPLFYKYLASGVRKSQALQLAKLDMIRSGRRDPYYWGAFVLVGDVSGVSTMNTRMETNWPWVSIFVLSILIIPVVLKIKRHMLDEHASELRDSRSIEIRPRGGSNQNER